MDTPKTRKCDYCQKSYHPRTARSAYCSDDCRYAAHRAKNGAAVGNPGLASQRRNATKAAQSRERVCLECGKSFITDGKAGRRIYCSDACKKRRFYTLHPEQRAIDNAAAAARYQRRKGRKA